MALVPRDLGSPALDFLAERHLATLTTLRTDSSPHSVPVGFTWDARTAQAWIITGGGSVKARQARRGGRASICQLDGARWMTLEGVPRVEDDPEVVAEAVRRYAVRYRQPRPNPERVALIVDVDRVLAGALLR